MIRLINISDLHFRNDWDEQVGLVFGKFLEDLKTSTSDGIRTILVFSGDLVQEGGDKMLFDSLYQKLNSSMSKYGIIEKNRIIIPGNHDICREQIKTKLLSHLGAIQQISNETDFNNSIESELKDILLPKFTNYFDFQDRFVSESNKLINFSGNGISLDDEIGIYLLNSAVCSHGGITDRSGVGINDKGKLMVNTRNIHRWISSSTHKFKVLVMHHPLDWLCSWARDEMEEIISQSFDVVLSGHVHQQKIAYVREVSGGAIHCSAPPLFTRKTDVLGYTQIEIDPQEKNVRVKYRQWCKPSGFVAGTLMAGNDSGILEFHLDSLNVPIVPQSTHASHKTTEERLHQEFETAATCYSSYKGSWITREFSDAPETAEKNVESILVSVSQLVASEKNLIIRAPAEYGLTCVGRRISLVYFQAKKSKLLVYLDVDNIQPHKEAVQDAICLRVSDLSASLDTIDGFVLDSIHHDKRSSAT